ncbi:MAG TPA: FAD-dependent oxidoreductase [Bryobacteraceae bacterium]|nr:FAD-dependent oxidoreductase [Bryobacteraceae bacterium]
MAQPVHFHARVESITRHDTDTATYVLGADKRLPRFVPGQFIHLAIDPYDPASFWPTSRVFSVANAVADRKTVQLTISRQGAFTSRVLDELVVGSDVWGKGPYGDFSLTPSADHAVVLIAGGTGVTPFASYMDAALTEGSLPAPRAILHYGARRPELLVYRELADRCASRVPGFTARYYAQDGAGDAAVRPGMLDVDAIVRDTGATANVSFYISGPRSMIRSFQSRLIETHHVPADHVLVDAWD